jgi:caa(3)-type oxidase subunit IV
MSNDPHAGRIGHAIVAKPDHAFNPDVDSVDPHGDHTGHHAHVIMSAFTLKFVLALLVAFTLLTVGQAQLELFIQSEFNIVFPKWVNVVACMGIATVKALLVCLFFMQLKYDNPLNSIVFMFTLLGVGLFLGFTALDLGTRGSIYEYKSKLIIPGGAGLGGSPATATARQALLEKVGPERFEEIRKDVESHKHGHGAVAVTGSTPGQSRPQTGTTPSLFDLDPPAAGSHEQGHGETAGHNAAKPGESKPAH